MCGRFALSLPREEVDARLEDVELHVEQWLNPDDYRPNYNLAPQNRAAVVRRLEPTNASLVVDCMKWGLVPHWTQAPPNHGTLLNTINARDDKVLEPRGLWNSVKSKRRCIVLCEGFFEWLTKGKEKIPHFTKRKDGQLMCLAGLWDSVTYKGETEALHTFTIITTSSNKFLSFLHDRMPVILPDRSSIEAWLDVSSSEWSPSLGKLLKPFDQPDGLVCYPVPKEVGKVGNQSADFLKPVSQRKGNIMSFFNKQSQAQAQASTKPAPSPSKPVEKEPNDLVQKASVETKAIEDETKDVKVKLPKSEGEEGTVSGEKRTRCRDDRSAPSDETGTDDGHRTSSVSPKKKVKRSASPE